MTIQRVIIQGEKVEALFEGAEAEVEIGIKVARKTGAGVQIRAITTIKRKEIVTEVAVATRAKVTEVNEALVIVAVVRGIEV